MTELDIAGLGIWGEKFSCWNEFSSGLNSGDWQTESNLQPELIASRERRRAPRLVKIAVEVMSQACEMAGLDPSDVATVFSSSMGDMQITDYMCAILAATPRAVSPTRFHNSVHNAATGYWSIATGSYAPASAVSAHSHTAPMAFLEAAIQVSEEDMPLLLVTQEMAAPVALQQACPSGQDFSAAFLLAPPGYCSSPIASLEFAVSHKSVGWPDLPEDLRQDLASNYGARLLPLLADLASASRSFSHEFPLSGNLCLSLSSTK